MSLSEETKLDSKKGSTPPLDGLAGDKAANYGDDSNGSSGEFAVVQEEEGSELMELPINKDNTLGVATLTHAFPGASGLKYKNPKTGASRALLMDSTGSKFIAPADGWSDKVFSVISHTSGRGGSESAWKRRKIEDDGDEEEEYGGKLKRLDDEAKKGPIDLIVLGVSFKTTPEAFKQYFEQFGTVVVADLKRDGDGKSKGFGFVQMSTLEEQGKVLDCSNHMMDGRRCEVKIPDQRTDVFHNPFAVREPSTNKIFVGRLPEKTTPEDLRAFFEKEMEKQESKVTITDVFIPRPFRGFGFVSFSSQEMAKHLVKQGNLVFQGASLAVSLAVPREAQEAMAPFGGFRAPVYGMNMRGMKGGMGGGGHFGYGMGGGYGGGAGYGGHGDWGMDNTAQARFFSWQSPSSSRSKWTRPESSEAAAPAAPAVPSLPSALANNFDALTLNRSNPDVFNAAWQLFMHTLKNGGTVPPSQPQGNAGGSVQQGMTGGQGIGAGMGQVMGAGMGQGVGAAMGQQQQNMGGGMQNLMGGNGMSQGGNGTGQVAQQHGMQHSMNAAGYRQQW